MGFRFSGIIYSVFIILFGLAAVDRTLPPVSFEYFAKFLAVSALLFLSFQGLGSLFRRKIFKSEIEFIDFPLGLALFALFASIFFKFSTAIALPCFLLILGISSQAYLFFNEQNWNFRKLSFEKTVEIALLIILILILVWSQPGTGLLLFPMDFDSGMLHVALPKRWLFIDEIKPQIYMRGAFLGNFAHVVYFFLLKVFNSSDAYLKTINFCCIIGLFSTCNKMSIQMPQLGKWPLLIPTLLVIYPDTREYLISTNLDTLFLIYLFSGTAVMLISLNSRKRDDLIIGTILLGFSAGLKHFGFMMSAPLLVFFYIYSLFYNCKFNISSIMKSVRFSIIGALIFLGVSLPFYLHNLLANNNILFPFFGSKENTYGWTAQEILDFGAIIEVWGHRKDFLGFFTLFSDLSLYPQKYQLLNLNTGLDFIYPSIFILAFVAFVMSIFLLFRGNKLAIIIALVNIVQLFFWYKGSQVVRYLLPNLAIGILFFIYIFANVFSSLKARYANQIVSIVLLAVSLVVFANSRAWQKPIPVTENAKNDIISSQYGDFYKAIDFIRKSGDKGRIFYVGDNSFMQNMVDLDVCGDWFGPCRWGDFYEVKASNEFLKFKPIAETQNFIRENRIRWVLVSWTYFFSYHKRPKIIETAIPDMKCYSHEKELATVDIYKINEECLKVNEH